ncbi:uncharacterized protein LOC111622674 [Centruroides sculpturatus]|uniref:uncharacterized protein LOC111622674 n=1 Tax=Centruroides sculpturatus TaxID=218467 RepID=UPI000C6E85A0|nr:uncharacterized protein LOC111622674 [Centruroides sculpturatus]
MPGVCTYIEKGERHGRWKIAIRKSINLADKNSAEFTDFLLAAERKLNISYEAAEPIPEQGIGKNERGEFIGSFGQVVKSEVTSSMKSNIFLSDYHLGSGY